MLDRHEPDKQFVENLEWQIGSEVRRRNRTVAPSHPMWKLARATALVAVSMAFGAVAMGASYQVEESWRKELLVAGLEVRINLALQRTDMAGEEYQRTARQFGAGVVGEETLTMAQLYVATTEAQARVLELELEEVRETGREPVGEVSSPLVNGRDFVSERIRVQMEVVVQQLDAATVEFQRMQTRYEVGTVDRINLASVEAALWRYEEQLTSQERWLEIRQAFLAGELSALEAELRVVEAEAEERSASIRQQMELVNLERDHYERRLSVGTVDPVTLRQVEFRLAELEAEVRLAELEMEIVRRKLESRRPQR